MDSSKASSPPPWARICVTCVLMVSASRVCCTVNGICLSLLTHVVMVSHDGAHYGIMSRQRREGGGARRGDHLSSRRLRGPVSCPASHAHGQASAPRSLAAGFPIGDGPNLWLFWCLGGAPRGVPLPPRTLDRASRPRLASRAVEHRARWRVPDLGRAPAPALRRGELEGGGPVAPVGLWPRPRRVALYRN